MKPRHLIVALLCSFLIAYPLSVGPFPRIERKNIAIVEIHWMGGLRVYYGKWDIYHGIYGPILWLCKVAPPFDHAMEWYRFGIQRAMQISWTWHKD